MIKADAIHEHFLNQTFYLESFQLLDITKQLPFQTHNSRCQENLSNGVTVYIVKMLTFFSISEVASLGSSLGCLKN